MTRDIAWISQTIDAHRTGTVITCICHFRKMRAILTDTSLRILFLVAT